MITKENINFDLYGKNVKVILKDGDEIIGVFSEDFEDDREIVVCGILISYDDIQEMIEMKKNSNNLNSKNTIYKSKNKNS